MLANPLVCLFLFRRSGTSPYQGRRFHLQFTMDFFVTVNMNRLHFSTNHKRVFHAAHKVTLGQ